MQTGKLLQKLNPSGAKYVKFSPNGEKILGVSWNSTIVWDVKTGQLLETLKHNKDINHAAFSPNSQQIISASRDGTARLWDISKLIYVEKPKEEPKTIEKPVETKIENPPVAPQITQTTDGKLNITIDPNYLGFKVLIVIGGAFIGLLVLWLVFRRIGFLRAHADKLIIGITMGLVVVVGSTAIVYYLFGSPEKASLSGLAMAIAAYFLTRDKA